MYNTANSVKYKSWNTVECIYVWIDFTEEGSAVDKLILV